MPYGITQCYLSLGRGDMLVFTPANLILDLATLDGWKAEFTWLAGLRLTLDYVLQKHNHIITILLY